MVLLEDLLFTVNYQSLKASRVFDSRIEDLAVWAQLT
jgi:hypothetical protein